MQDEGNEGADPAAEPPGTGKREKGEGWIPRLMEAKKDVISCEKLRGTANKY